MHTKLNKTNTTIKKIPKVEQNQISINNKKGKHITLQKLKWNERNQTTGTWRTTHGNSRSITNNENNQWKLKIINGNWKKKQWKLTKQWRTYGKTQEYSATLHKKTKKQPNFFLRLRLI